MSLNLIKNSYLNYEATEMKETTCEFSIGELIQHELFNYRGVIVDIDPVFQGTEAWYDQMAGSKPPKNKPWYHVIVHNARHMTYVAERNLCKDVSNKPIENPMLSNYFDEFKNLKYRCN